MNVQLTAGELALITRALRYYHHAEHGAIQTAWQTGDRVHHADVQRQVEPRLRAVESLIERLITVKAQP